MTLKYDEIGRWSEIKLDIIEKYAVPYSKILSSRSTPFHYVYIDAFAGSGKHISKTTGDLILGSPRRILQIQPSFNEYYFIDIDGAKTEELRKEVANRSDVHILNGDCNSLLITDVFPHVKWKEYRRGLCLLDPYGLDLDWKVIETAGNMKSIDMILNFPVMDMNRNVLRNNPDIVSKSDIERMNKYWGDESWREVVYKQTPTLFGEWDIKQRTNDTLALAFKERLKKVAGFKYVLNPIPMKNSNNAIIYYLFFASQQKIADNIVKDIF